MPTTASVRSRKTDVAQEQEAPVRRLPIGAEVQPAGGVHFRVWAPKCRKVEVVLEGEIIAGSEMLQRVVELEPGEDGYFADLAADATNGSLYRYRLDEGKTYPDPASRYQPHGPDGPSQVVDPDAYSWSDKRWKGLTLEGQVLYELHLGTFTREGTWTAAAQRLSRLAELGVTAVEVMPVAEFPGAYGWGYDGVDLFAPYHHYGTPDDMRRFVDQAHALAIGVLLDVVYNHLGPDHCYHHAFSQYYPHRKRPGNDWGDSLNFDGPKSGRVREYFIANAGYWISEYHLDGLRLDATQAIHDNSKENMIAAVCKHARAAAGKRNVLLVAENEPQNVRLIGQEEQGGYGLDGLWNDDFHHSARVALTGHAEAYYCDFRGTAQELISAVKWGYLFQGQIAKWPRKRRGTCAFGVPAARFVTYLENHDQVANSALGLRIRELTSPGRYRALTALWLLAPQTPMLFQGQELGTSKPFLYFSDHRDHLADLVREGRREELAGFRSTTHPALRDFLPDPSSPESFEVSKLDEPENYADLPAYALIHDLLKLRREDEIFREQTSQRLHGAVLGPEAFVLRYFSKGTDCRLILINLGRDLYPTPNSEPLLAPPPGMRWKLLWFSEHPRYGGSGIPPLEADQPWRLSGHCAVVLTPEPDDSPVPEEPPMGSARVEDHDIHPKVRRERSEG
jgi:maltooligosyltrehalose trehalohydrolase